MAPKKKSVEEFHTNNRKWLDSGSENCILGRDDENSLIENLQLAFYLFN